MHRKARAGGFTLLEVLAALAIFALAAIALGTAYANVLNAYDLVMRGNQSDEDVRFARAQLLAEPDVKKIEEGGEFESAGGRRAKWSAKAEPFPVVDVFSVTFTCEVTDPSRPEPEATTETFMLLRPTWSDPVERSTLLEVARERILQMQAKRQ